MFWWQVALAAICVAGCQGNREVDAEREALLEADRKFAIETARRGADGWAEFFSDDGVMFPPRGRVDGRESIRKRMESSFAPGAPRLVWEPTDAIVGSGGDLGYTLGRWKSVLTDKRKTDSVLAQGNYVTIWRKDKAREWRVAVDIGNQDESDSIN